jgi:hypothetical protein
MKDLNIKLIDRAEDIFFDIYMRLLGGLMRNALRRKRGRDLTFKLEKKKVACPLFLY